MQRSKVFTRKPLAEKVADLYPRSLESQIHMMTDLLFWRPAVAYASAQSHYAPVWMYRFDWHPKKPPYNKAFHALELPFVFGNLDGLERMAKAEITDEVKQLSHDTISVDHVRQNRKPKHRSCELACVS